LWRNFITAETGWQRSFFEPIELPDGRKLVTLMDADKYISSLPLAV
jgi:hypothetical protein